MVMPNATTAEFIATGAERLRLAMVNSFEDYKKHLDLNHLKVAAEDIHKLLASYLVDLVIQSNEYGEQYIALKTPGSTTSIKLEG